jgi:hypothetical protein
MKELKDHPHSAYVEYMDPPKLEDIIFQAYRKCRNKFARQERPVLGGDQQCSACNHRA